MRNCPDKNKKGLIGPIFTCRHLSADFHRHKLESAHATLGCSGKGLVDLVRGAGLEDDNLLTDAPARHSVDRRHSIFADPTRGILEYADCCGSKRAPATCSGSVPPEPSQAANRR